MTQDSFQDVLLWTELGEVRLSLDQGSKNERRTFKLKGPDDASSYVYDLLSTSYGVGGRLIGSTCTEAELKAVLSGPLAALKPKFRT